MAGEAIEIPEFDFEGVDEGVINDDPKDINDPKDDPSNDPKDEDPKEDPLEDPKGEDPEEEEETDPLEGEEEEEDDDPVDENEDDEPSDDESTIVSEVIEGLGLEFGEDEEFEDTPEGLVKLANVASTKLASEKLGKIFASHPTLKAHVEYLQKGGDPDKFFQTYTPEVDYEKMELKEDDADGQKALLTNYFKLRGEDTEFINDMIESYEDKGTLKARADKALEALKKSQSDRKEKLLEEQREADAAKQKAAEAEWQEIQTIVNEGEDLAGIPMSKKDRTGLMDYISKPVTREGYTQRDLDMQKADLKTQLALDFLMYKKLKLGEFIDKKATTKSTKTLKERMAKSKKVGKEGAGRSSSKSKNPIADLDFDLSNMGD